MDSTSETPESHAGRAGGWLGKLIPAVLVVAAAALVGFVALMPSDTVPLPSSEVPPVNVRVQPVRALPELADTFDLTAVVEPNRVVRVAAEVDGRIEKVGFRQREIVWRGRLLPAGAPLREGEPIFRGDPIVHLNKDLLQARFDRARAQFRYDESECRRISSLFEEGTASKSELDELRTRRDVSRAMLDEARAELSRGTILAPIGGIVNRLPLEVGEYAVPGDCVAEIVEIDVVKVVVDVPERDVHYMAVGQVAEIFRRKSQGGKLTGEITYISELADEQTRTTRLEIAVDNVANLLRSGQIVRVRLTRRILTDVIMIELGAVIPLENGKAVYVVNDEDRAERREIELGLIKGRRVQVLSGLEDGDRLIVAGHRYVGPHQPVTVVEGQ